jgi:hypothetical protein
MPADEFSIPATYLQTMRLALSFAFERAKESVPGARSLCRQPFQIAAQKPFHRSIRYRKLFNYKPEKAESFRRAIINR